VINQRSLAYFIDPAILVAAKSREASTVLHKDVCSRMLTAVLLQEGIEIT
jgi:hypothetical protein